jgi:hypothetical protein
MKVEFLGAMLGIYFAAWIFYRLIFGWPEEYVEEEPTVYEIRIVDVEIEVDREMDKR